MAVAGSGDTLSGGSWKAGVHCTLAVRSLGERYSAGGVHWNEENDWAAQDCSSSRLVSDHHTVLGCDLRTPGGNSRHMEGHGDRLDLCLHPCQLTLHLEGRASMTGFGHTRDNHLQVRPLEAAAAAADRSIVPPSCGLSRCALGRGNLVGKEIRRGLGHESRCRKVDDYDTAKEMRASSQ